jgi:hypothetical protein
MSDILFGCDILVVTPRVDHAKIVAKTYSVEQYDIFQVSPVMSVFTVTYRAGNERKTMCIAVVKECPASTGQLKVFNATRTVVIGNSHWFRCLGDRVTSVRVLMNGIGGKTDLQTAKALSPIFFQPPSNDNVAFGDIPNFDGVVSAITTQGEVSFYRREVEQRRMNINSDDRMIPRNYYMGGLRGPIALQGRFADISRQEEIADSRLHYVRPAPIEEKRPRIDIGDEEEKEACDIPAEDNACVICFEAQISAMCYPCNHLSFCGACIKEWLEINNTCPVCKQLVEQVIRPFRK